MFVYSKNTLPAVLSPGQYSVPSRYAFCSCTTYWESCSSSQNSSLYLAPRTGSGAEFQVPEDWNPTCAPPQLDSNIADALSFYRGISLMTVISSVAEVEQLLHTHAQNW